MVSNSEELNHCSEEMIRSVDLGSQQITLIQVFYYPKNGYLFGMIFFAGNNQIARIGYKYHADAASIKIHLTEGEKIVGVSSS